MFDEDWFELFADINEIISHAEKHYVNLYYPIIGRTEYKLIDRAIKLLN